MFRPLAALVKSMDIDGAFVLVLGLGGYVCYVDVGRGVKCDTAIVIDTMEICFNEIHFLSAIQLLLESASHELMGRSQLTVPRINNIYPSCDACRK